MKKHGKRMASQKIYPTTPSPQMPKASDEMLVQKLYQAYSEGNHAHFSKPRLSQTAFSVGHYAGAVCYESEGFVEKNLDSIASEHTTLLRASKVGHVM